MHGHILSMKKDLGEGDSMEMNHSKEDFLLILSACGSIRFKASFFFFSLTMVFLFWGGKRREKAIFWLNVSTVASAFIGAVTSSW